MGFQMVHFSNKMDDILREKRVVQGLTQQQVADRAKISLRQYQSFESGERNIRTASFQLAWLLGWTRQSSSMVITLSEKRCFLAETV